jgi:hypothetical protein
MPVILALLLVSFPASAQMYKCVDERGVTHYTDKPRPGCKGREVDIRPSPSLSGSEPQSPGQDFQRQDADFKRRQLERADAEAAGKAEMDKHCARLKREHTLLAGGSRVAKITPQGQRIYIDDATRDARLAELNDALRTCP